MEIVDEIKQAVEYTRLKEFKKAENIYLNLLKSYPENDSVLSFLGLLYFNQMRYKKAEKYLTKAYQISQSKIILSYVGITKFLLSKYNVAVIYLEEAVKYEKTIEVYKALVISCSKAGIYKKGYAYAIEAYNLFPFDEKILQELSFNCLQTGRFKDSEIYSKKLLALNSKSYSAWFNLGLLEELLYCNEAKARECYKNMIKCGDKTGGYINLAISYSKELKDRKKAYYYLRKTEQINPNKSGLHFLFAAFFLSTRQFNKGFKYYTDPDIESQDDADWFAQFKRKWKGEDCKNETLFVYGDQGIGDQLQFSRYLPFLQKKFKSIKVMVPDSLINLFKRSFKSCKKITFYPRKTTFPRYDKSLMMSNAIYHLNKKFSDIPYSNGYLKADDKKIEEYKSRYFSTEKLKVGICWEAGAAGIRDQIHRTLNIELFDKIIKMENTQVYSFQVKPSLDRYKEYTQLVDLASTFKSFDETAAALKNLDILITVDTSVAHLAGALGIKTFLILPYCADWRWFDNTQTTEWYDSVRIFKQGVHEDWNSVFEKIFKELNNSI